MTATTPRVAIEDNGVPKDFDDITLSDRARAIVKKVRKTHALWLRLAAWGAKDLNTVKDVREIMAFRAYHDLRAKIKATWPLWSTTMTDQDVDTQRFAIQATHARVKSLYPEAFREPDEL